MKPGLTDEELDAIVRRIGTADRGQASEAAGYVNPVALAGAPSAERLHELLDRVAGEVAADPPGRVTHRDNDRLFHDPAANVLDLGTCPWPT